MARLSNDAAARVLRQTREAERRVRNEVPSEFPERPKRVRRRLFELKTSLSGGGTATAYLRRSDFAGVLTTDTSITFTVSDDIGDREGTGRDDAGSGAGAYGKAEKLPGNPFWLVYDLQCVT